MPKKDNSEILTAEVKARVTPDTKAKLEFVSRRLRIEQSEGIRKALEAWLTEKLWSIKLDEKTSGWLKKDED